MYQISDLEVDRFFGEYERKNAPPIGECDFCGAEILKNGESYQLSDGRYVCPECAGSVFKDEFIMLPLSEQADIVGAGKAE